MLVVSGGDDGCGDGGDGGDCGDGGDGGGGDGGEVRLDTGGGEVELLGTGETPGAGDDIPGDVSGEWFFVVKACACACACACERERERTA